MKPWPWPCAAGLSAGLAAARWHLSTRLGAWSLALLAVFGSDEVCAAALPGNLTSSVGLLAALAAWLVVKAWSTPGLAESMGGMVAVAAVAAATAWLWRARAGTLAGKAVASGVGMALRPSGPRPLPMSARGDAPASAVITLPPGLALAPLLHEMRARFVLLQAAWDAGDLSALRALVTTPMLDQLCETWPDRSAGNNRTDVVTLDAELLGFEELGDSQLVTVEFSGLIRESDQQGAAPFRELWMLARSRHGECGWKLARQQALL